MILLVEDRPVSRRSLAELLRSFGHDVLEAENTEQALELLENPVALVITDFVLADAEADGLKLIGLIRERRPSMPIILLSGYLAQETGEGLVMMAGLRMKYFTKPVDPLLLEATIQNLLTQ